MPGRRSSVACEGCGESNLTEARMLIFSLCFIEGSYVFASLLFGYMALGSKLLGPCLCFRHSFLRILCFLESANGFFHRSQMLLDILAVPSLLRFGFQHSFDACHEGIRD